MLAASERAPALMVGLVRSGNRTHQRNPLRSVAPSLYAQAWQAMSGAVFYSLQIDGSEDANGRAQASGDRPRRVA